MRSDGRNLAVNIWWDNYKNRQLDIEACPKKFNANLTLDQVEFGGFENAHGETVELRFASVYKFYNVTAYTCSS